MSCKLSKAAIVSTLTWALLAAGAAAAEPAGKTPPSAEKKVAPAAGEKLPAVDPALNKPTIQRVQWAPSFDIARAINKLYQGQPQVRVEAEPVSNSLLISAPPALQRDVLRDVEQLDVRPATFAIEFWIVQIHNSQARKPGGAAELMEPEWVKSLTPHSDPEALLREWEKRGELFVAAHARIATLDNQPAFVQVGERVGQPAPPPRPPVAGKSAAAGMPMAAAFSYQNVGWIFRVVGRKSGQHDMTCEMDLERSEVKSSLRPDDKATVEGSLEFHRKTGDHDTSLEVNVTAEKPPARSLPSPIDVAIVQTTLTLHDGETVMPGGLAIGSHDGKTTTRENTVFLVRARFVAPRAK